MEVISMWSPSNPKTSEFENYRVERPSLFIGKLYSGASGKLVVASYAIDTESIVLTFNPPNKSSNGTISYSWLKKQIGKDMIIFTSDDPLNGQTKYIACIPENGEGDNSVQFT